VVQSLIEASAALDELWAQILPGAWGGTTVCEPDHLTQLRRNVSSAVTTPQPTPASRVHNLYGSYS